MRILTFFTALLLSLSIAFPVTAQDSGEQPSGTISVEDSAKQDAAIAVRIRDILGELDGYDDVTVTVSSGIVSMRGTTLDAAHATRLNDLAGRVAGVVAIENEVTETTDVVERLNPAIERFMDRSLQLLAYLPLLAVALLAFFIVVFIGFFIAKRRQPWDKLAPNLFIADIYRQIIRLAAMIAALVVMLDILGATALLSTILGAAGIIGLAFGFAVRDTVENFISSIMLSVRQPFRPNDSVEIGGDTGKVIRLTSRATILLSYDGNQIRIPNSTVFKSRIVNFSRNDERRFQFDLGVACDTDLARAREVGLEVLEALPFVLSSPAPSIWTKSVGDSTVIMGFTGWISQRKTSLAMARSEAIRLSLNAFSQAGISMPEPTYRLITDLDGVGVSSEKQTPKPKPAPQKAAPVLSAAEMDDNADQELENIVNAERKVLTEDDLLNREGASQE
ncbi:MAG: mechanosensitive ion channel family protein [Rhodobacterales bacterium]|nr:mechanosensitive ion channel family protein [Rhodobacterales bacterium]